MRRPMSGFDPEKRRRRLGPGFAILGGLGLAFVAACAISHYVFHVPVHQGHSNHLEPEGSIAMTLTALGAGNALFVVMGAGLMLLSGRR